ncbi:oligoribonuclease-like isoform X2 [Actinidia eriantha]|uniref:oligoribonuclease-like isoform X2 n=1 Tax=Actinidia eriantha TaxID=165200 RepID=UPI002582CD86|nr:oligoribonuclease-like isoform X2 [Actinidia eriantha]
MNQLANTFSVLELDVADERTATVVADDHRENANGIGKGKKKGDSLGDMTLIKNDNGVQQGLDIVSGKYKLPLVWIDLEMTGLNVEVDRILEIACVITDGNLTKSIEGPDLVVSQSKAYLDRMGEWCQAHHAASGLTEKVLESTIGEQEAEKQKYMPDLASLFHHVVVDVSSVKALCLRWYPKENKKAPSKKNKHRAMDDIRESIAELKYFKEHIFKPSKPRK